ncbi:MAG: hypothetical protein WCD04_11800 [Terriglobia bacterium]|jgi:hypothetical protein
MSLRKSPQLTPQLLAAASSQTPQGVEAVENLKMNELCGNVYENKGPLWKTGAEAGMLLKTNIVTLKMRECY